MTLSLKTRWTHVRKERPNNQNQRRRYTFGWNGVVHWIIILTTHLLIDNIQGKNTETVELLFSSSRANRVEGAAENMWVT